MYVSKLLDSSKFQLYLCSLDIQANSTKLVRTFDLSNVSSKYHEFANVFSKIITEVLTPYYPYDLQINLEEDTQSLVGPIYSLLISEQEALKKFIEKNLNTGFIWPTFSLYSILVLFVKKKDSSLCLCVDFCSLNYIYKKDHYPLPFISDLLDSPYKAKTYTKIDLFHIYYLVHIADGNKWKTTFRTYYGSFK